MAGNSGTSETHRDREKPAGYQSEAAAGAAETGAREQSPMARGGSASSAATSQEASDRGAAAIGWALGFTLSASPFRLRRLRSVPSRRQRKKKNEKQKGDTSNEVTKGTFLKSFDIRTTKLDFTIEQSE